MMMMMILAKCTRSARADEADAFAKIGNIFRQKLPQTNKGASGIYGNRNKTDFSSPVKFVLLFPLAKGMKFVAGSDFLLFFLSLVQLCVKALWSGQIPFDVCPFSRKSWLKGGESWIKANLLSQTPDATTGDSTSLVYYN